MYCNICGTLNKDGAKYCISCGAYLLTDDAQRKDYSQLTYYEILEISSDASPEIIKAAYKALVKKIHPDNNAEVYSDDKRTIQDINNAYDVLSDPQKRKQYDDFLKSNSTQTHENINQEEQSTGEDINKNESSVKVNAVELVGTLLVFTLFNYFQFDTWLLVIISVLASYFSGQLFGSIICKGLCLKKIQLAEEQQEQTQAMMFLFTLLFFFHYLNISDWVFKLCLGIFIIDVVVCIILLIKENIH